MAVMYDVKPGRRGVPTLVSVRASELADLQDELTAERQEGRAFALRVLDHSGVIAAAIPRQNDRLIEQRATELAYLADRRLRQLTGGTDDAA